MNLLLISELLSGGPGSGCRGSNCGRPASGSDLFISPNTGNLDFLKAMRNLKSHGHSDFKNQVITLAQKMSNNPRVHDAIGDWSDGAENSLVLHAQVGKGKIDYMGAVLGESAKQKAVLPFVESKNGKDTLWNVDVPKEHSIDSIRQTMSDNGVQFRTITPMGDTTRIYVYDGGSKLQDNITKIANQFGVNYGETKGNGRFINADKYQKIISSYKAGRSQEN